MHALDHSFIPSRLKIDREWYGGGGLWTDPPWDSMLASLQISFAGLYQSTPTISVDLVLYRLLAIDHLY